MPKSALRFPLILLFGIYALYSCVLHPLVETLSADVVTSPALISVLNILFLLVEVIGLAVAFGFLIQAVYTYGVKKSLSLYFVVAGALFFKYIAAIISRSIVYGSIDLTADYSSTVVAFLVELLQCAVVVFLAHKLVGGLLESEKEKEKAARRLEVSYRSDLDPVSFKTLLKIKHPLQRTAFWSMILLFAVRLCALVIEIITDYLFWQDYTAADLFYWLQVFALEVLLPVLLVYPLILLSVMLANRQNKNA